MTLQILKLIGLIAIAPFLWLGICFTFIALFTKKIKEHNEREKYRQTGMAVVIGTLITSLILLSLAIWILNKF